MKVSPLVFIYWICCVKTRKSAISYASSMFSMDGPKSRLWLSGLSRHVTSQRLVCAGVSQVAVLAASSRPPSHCQRAGSLASSASPAPRFRTHPPLPLAGSTSNLCLSVALHSWARSVTCWVPIPPTQLARPHSASGRKALQGFCPNPHSCYVHSMYISHSFLQATVAIELHRWINLTNSFGSHCIFSSTR